MAFVQIPKDLNKVKTKIIFNLTKRQLICFSSALAAGLPVFFGVKAISSSVQTSAVVIVIVMLPFFLFAMFEKHGQPLEVILKHITETLIIRPKIRQYQTDNYYAILGRQSKVYKEVELIVNGKAEKKNH